MFWSGDAADFLHYDVGVVSVGTGDSLAWVEAASVGSVGSAAAASLAGVTVTEAVGAGRSGATPWGRTGGSWEGSMPGSVGKGARPGMLRGGRDARGGTEEAEGRRKKTFNYK